MPDFKFIEIPNSSNWIISAPKRAKRPYLKGRSCVFCPGNEEHDPEVYRIPELEKGSVSDWKVRVISNRYPFAPIHEVVILTRTHTKHMRDMTRTEYKLSLEAFVNRYNTHKDAGNVCIFGNSGHDAGESINHPHAQIAVIPKQIPLQIPKLERDLHYYGEHFQVGEFLITCPPYSKWPDEIWIIPTLRHNTFSKITLSELESLSYIWQRLNEIMTIRHGKSFPHNFYIYPGHDWYLRIIPRDKIAGGFEMMTDVYVNTQDPHETMQFIREHFTETEEKKIRKSRARYRKGV